MSIKNGKEKEFRAWELLMTKSGFISSVRLLRWFFNLIDLERLDIGSIVYNFCHTAELYEAFDIKDSEKWRIFLSVIAIIRFHKKGEEFRICWNTAFLGENYVLEIENRNKAKNIKYIFNPYKKQTRQF